jgi:hypothetical protein
MNAHSKNSRRDALGKIVKACVRFFTRTFGKQKSDDVLLRRSPPSTSSSRMAKSATAATADSGTNKRAEQVDKNISQTETESQNKELYVDRGKPVPDEYGRNVLRGFARDPAWLFVYWELSPNRLNKLKQEYTELHTCTWQLRIIDIGDKTTQDTPVFLSAYNWYLNVTPRHEYKAELGFIHKNTFVSILTSDTVRMPGDTISSRFDEEWMVLHRDIMKMMHLRSETDLLGPGHPRTSADRFVELTSEQRELLQRQAEEARTLSSSGGASSPHPHSFLTH